MPQDSKKVLIIEDDQALNKALTQKFEREGFTVLQAFDGEEGLAVSLSEHPDVILLDIILPKMDGMTMLEELRKDEWGNIATVLLLSNLNEPETMGKGANLNVSDYLVKADWRLDDVVHRVEDRLKFS